MKLDKFPHLKKVLASDKAEAGSIMEYGDWADAHGKVELEELLQLLGENYDARDALIKTILKMQETAKAAIEKINTMAESDFPDPNQRSNESKAGVLYIQQEVINKTSQILDTLMGMRTS